MNYTSQLQILHFSFVFSHINKCPQCAEFHLKVHLVVSLVKSHLIGVHSHEKTEGVHMKGERFACADFAAGSCRFIHRIDEQKITWFENDSV